jgi:hypothetical protein
LLKRGGFSPQSASFISGRIFNFFDDGTILK